MVWGDQAGWSMWGLQSCHHMPHVSSLSPHGVWGTDTDGQHRGLAVGKRGRAHLGTGWLWWLCRHHVLSPWFALLHFFCSYRAGNAGVPRDMPPGGGLAPQVRTEREVPSPEGTQLEMAAPGRCGDTNLSLP